MPDIYQPITITICGDGGCGKSAITLRLVKSEWSDDYDPTIEDSYSVSRTIDGHSHVLRLTDTAGQEEYRGLWATSNLKSDAFLLVYDITNHDSLVGLEQFTELISLEGDRRVDDVVPFEPPARDRTGPSSSASRFFSSARRHSASRHKRMVPRQIAPVMVMAGNKCDLEHARAVSESEAHDWALTHACTLIETSAREEINIEEAFSLIVRRVVERRRRIWADVPLSSAYSSPSNTSAGASSTIGGPGSTVDKSSDAGRDWASPPSVPARSNVSGDAVQPGRPRLSFRRLFCRQNPASRPSDHRREKSASAAQPEAETRPKRSSWLCF